ncbi:hypothetical protein [Qipengyuania nanhaisediminis]|uniref:hypothetical protein n=1 Tax=Qipengyuania nanhaisediminis TaxID=604088 RepID=UPI0038B38A58
MTGKRTGRAEGKRKQLRSVRRSSVLSKQFKRDHDFDKKIQLTRMHPIVVQRDLQDGNLDSLVKYIIQKKGIPDLAIAYQLLMLIAGGATDSRYRLVVVEHPDLPKNVGGAPSRNGRPRDLAFEVVEELRSQTQAGDDELRVSSVAEKFKISSDKVEKYEQAVTKYEKSLRSKEERQAARRSKNREQFQSALEVLKRSQRGEAS